MGRLCDDLGLRAMIVSSPEKGADALLLTKFEGIVIYLDEQFSSVMRIRQVESELGLNKSPILALVGGECEVLPMGADAFLTLPCDQSTLKNSILRLVGRTA